MKLKLIVLFCTMVLAFAAHAGGEGCSSKKGHGGKDMSAQSKEFKDNHAWLFSDSESDASTPDHKTLKDTGPSSSSAPDKSLVEI